MHPAVLLVVEVALSVEGGGAELKYRAIHVCKLRWSYGTSGEWGSEGLVNVMGSTAGTGRR